MDLRRIVLVVVMTMPCASVVAQVAQPGQAAADAEGTPATEATPRLHSWDAPPVYQTIVVGGAREEDLIGAYKQPRWSAARLFPTTRVYVLPAETVQLEVWLDTQLAFREAENVRFRNRYELEIGLGHRLQLDLYLGTEQQGIDGKLGLESERIELRYAFADWGVAWGNPTIYLEFARHDEGPPTLEAKLLLGGGIVPRLHWGLNLVFESALAGSDWGFEYAVTGGLAYALVDSCFSLGGEIRLAAADKMGSRFRFADVELMAGPSLQWRPVPPVHIDLVLLFGALAERVDDTLHYKAAMNPLLVVGWEF